MRQGAEGCYVEDWVGVFAILEASLGKDDGDEMDAGAAEKWNC